LFKSKAFELSIGVAGFLTVSLLANFRIVFSSGVVTAWDWPFPPYREQITGAITENWFAWSGLDDRTLARGGWLIAWIGQGLAVLGTGSLLLTRLYLIVPMSLAGFTFYYLIRNNRGSPVQGLVGGLFYMFSPWMYERLVGGSFADLLTYSVLPFCYLLFTKQKQSMRQAITNSILIGLVILPGDIVAYGIVILFLMLYGIVDLISTRDLRRFAAYCFSLLVIAGFLIIANAFWIFPTFLFGGAAQATAQVPISDLVIRSTDSQLINVVRVFGTVQNFYPQVVMENQALSGPWLFAGFLVASLAFFAVVLEPRNKTVVFSAALATGSIFLATGLNPPLGGIYLWAFLHVPFFQAFREPTKWSMLTSFAYAAMLSVVVDHASRIREVRLPSLGIRRFSVHMRKIVSVFLICLMLGSVLLFCWPGVTGNYDKFFQTVNFPQDYKDAYDWLASQAGDFRVLWLPPDLYIQYRWIPYSYQQADVMAMYSPKQNFMYPSLAEDYGRFSYFIAYLLYHNSTAEISRLLALSGVKYLLLRHDADPWLWRNLGYSEAVLVSTLRHQAGLCVVREFGPIDVYLNDAYRDSWHVRAADGGALSTGGPALLASMSTMPSNNLETIPIIFAEQLNGEDMSTLAGSFRAVYVVNDDFLDYTFAFLPGSYVRNVGDFANEGNVTFGWARLYGSNYWYLGPPSYGFLDSEVDPAISVSNVTLTVPVHAETTGVYEGYMRIFVDPYASGMNVSLDGNRIDHIRARSAEVVGYQWVSLGESYVQQGDHLLQIHPDGLGVNLISRLVFASKSALDDASAQAQAFLQGKEILLAYTNPAQTQNVSTRCFNVPKGGEYNISVQLPYEAADSWLNLDNATRLPLVGGGAQGWFEASDVKLSSGGHCLSFNQASMSLLVLTSAQGASNQPVPVTYQELDPTRYTVRTVSGKGSIIVLFDAYDPYWVATSNGDSSQSFPVYGAFDGFWVETESQTPITLQFTHQIYFTVGIPLSGITILVSILIVGYAYGYPELKKLRVFRRIESAKGNLLSTT
jgi:hypothetical protein